MRTALLSTIETTEQGEKRAFLQMGGRNLIDWQLDLVRDLGCERVICISHGPSAHLDGFRSRVEQLGMEFHAIGGPLQLVGLVSADQDLVVLGDGVIFDREFLAESFPKRRGVAVLPAAAGIKAGFERVDANNAWAGLFVARAQIAEQLAEMPADSDTVSLLLRMALQAGTKLVKFDAEKLEDGSLLLATDASIVESRETILLDRSSQRNSWMGTGNALAQVLARRMAKSWISKGPALSFAAAILGAIGAAMLTWMYQPVWALAALFFASLTGSFSVALFNLKAKLLGAERPSHLSISINILIDLVLIISLVLPLSNHWDQRLFLAVMLLGSWRLAELVSSARFASFWRDRPILIGLLIISAIIGISSLVIQLFILAALAYCLFLAGSKRITRA